MLRTLCCTEVLRVFGFRVLGLGGSKVLRSLGNFIGVSGIPDLRGSGFFGLGFWGWMSLLTVPETMDGPGAATPS